MPLWLAGHLKFPGATFNTSGPRPTPTEQYQWSPLWHGSRLTPTLWSHPKWCCLNEWSTRFHDFHQACGTFPNLCGKPLVVWLNPNSQFRRDDLAFSSLWKLPTRHRKEKNDRKTFTGSRAETLPHDRSPLVQSKSRLWTVALNF